MAKRRGRPVSGVLLLDKPQGLSSNQALQRVKRLYGAAKAGHTGALDPLATGMLPVCLGEATKFSQFLLDSDKRYITTAKLGVRTTTSDAEGEVLETRPVPGLVRAELEALLATRFLGEITQVPSIYSALKHQGQPLYKLARKGVEVEVKQRRVTIYEIRLLDCRADELDIEVFCSKGTYIRSIVEDLGQLLGCGAHVSMLRRLSSGSYQAAQMITLDALQACAGSTPEEDLDPEEKNSRQQRLDALLLPPWGAVAHLPQLLLTNEQASRIRHGQPLDRVEATPGLVRLFAQDETEPQFLGLGEVTGDASLLARRLISTGT